MALMKYSALGMTGITFIYLKYNLFTHQEEESER